MVAPKISDFWTSTVITVLVIIKLSEGLQIVLSWPWGITLQIFLGKVCHKKTSWNNISFAKAFIPKNVTASPAVSCWLKALRIRADFLCVVRLWEGHPTCKISLDNLYSELKACMLPYLLSRRVTRDKRW